MGEETLRRWMLAEGLWSRMRRRKAHRKRRARREHFGDLVQLDGSFHAWFEERGPRGCLMNMVDDATGDTNCRMGEQETIWEQRFTVVPRQSRNTHDGSHWLRYPRPRSAPALLSRTCAAVRKSFRPTASRTCGTTSETQNQNQTQTPCACRSPLEKTMEADISIWQKTGHFYFALTRAMELR